MNTSFVDINKFSKRTLACPNLVIQKRIKFLTNLDYSVKAFKEKGFDQSLPIFTIILTIQEVAVEVWQLTILGEHKTKGGFAFWMGAGLGLWVGWPLFTRFNSLEYISHKLF